MVWAQAMPFVVLQLYEEKEDGVSKDAMSVFLTCSFVFWLMLNIMFFCTIGITFVNTFFDLKTASQYTCERFRDAKDDEGRFAAIFVNRFSMTKPIHDEVKTWVRDNIVRWRMENESWFDVTLIFDGFLPVEVFHAEGGANRRRSSVSFKEAVGMRTEKKSKVHPEPSRASELTPVSYTHLTLPTILLV